MTAWPKDNQAARNAFYGDPAKGDIPAQLVPVVPPFIMRYEGKPIKSIMFHKKAAPALHAALNEIWDAYGRDQAKIDAAGISKYAGAYNHRMVRGSSTKWSNHAYGAAIDLNAEENGLYQKGNMPQPVIDAFLRQGWMWGGDYQGRKDPMHFEAVDNGGRKPKSAPPKPVAMVVPVAAKNSTIHKPTAAVTALGGVAVVGAGAAAKQGVSAMEILAWIGGLSGLAVAGFIIGFRYYKGHWPWTSTGNQSQEVLPLSRQQSAPSLADLSAAQLALQSAGSPAKPLPKSSVLIQPLKPSAKRSQKTPTRARKSSNSKRTAAKKSAPKRKSKSKR